jgi:hypothetical protein
MSTISQAKAIEMCTLYMEAEEAVLKGQSYSIGDRSLTRADLKQIATQRKYWCNKADQLAASRTAPKVTQVIPRDN